MDDPFGILGLPRRFSLTASEISAAHLRAVSRLHPDRASNPLERDRLVQAAAAAGSAKQRLLKDTSRAEELIELLGARPLLAAPLAPGFLMDTMEIREAIDEAIASGDPDELARIATRVRALRDEALSELRDALDTALAALDAGGADPAAASAAAAALVRLRYVDRMVDRIAGNGE
jgi:molecular chaperone HscB